MREEDGTATTYEKDVPDIIERHLSRSVFER